MFWDSRRENSLKERVKRENIAKIEEQGKRNSLGSTDSGTGSDSLVEFMSLRVFGYGGR